MQERLQSPCAALRVHLFIDRRGNTRQKAHAQAVAKTADASCPEWVVAFTDGTEADTGGTHARLDVRNAEEDDFVTARLEPAGECGHGVDVAGPCKTECAEFRHGRSVRRVSDPWPAGCTRPCAVTDCAALLCPFPA